MDVESKSWSRTGGILGKGLRSSEEVKGHVWHGELAMASSRYR